MDEVFSDHQLIKQKQDSVPNDLFSYSKMKSDIEQSKNSSHKIENKNPDSDSNQSNGIKKQILTPKDQSYESFSQQLIMLDSENAIYKKAQHTLPMNNRRQTRRHQSYVKSRIGQQSEDDMPLTQLHHQSIMRKIYNKIRIQFQVKSFVNNMLSLLSRNKYKAFVNNSLFFTIINDKSANYDQDLLSKRNLYNEQTQTFLQKQANNQLTLKKNNQMIQQQSLRNSNQRSQRNTCSTHLQKLMHKIPIFSPFSRFRIIWDQIQLFCLGFFFIVIPLIIAFNLSIKEIERNHSIHRVFIAFLMLDILINFNTSLFQQGREIRSRLVIARNYLKNGNIN